MDKRRRTAGRAPPFDSAPGSGPETPAARGVPTSDPAYAVLAGILALVNVSVWHFARVEPNGPLRFFPPSTADERTALAEELRRQRAVAKRGRRIAATLLTFAGAASGVTLIFGDARGDYGILVLLREPVLGAFTSSEIAMLTFALDAGSDRLSDIRLAARAEVAKVEPSSHGLGPPLYHDDAMYVLDGDLRIVLASSVRRGLGSEIMAGSQTPAQRLPLILEESVRALTASWATSGIKEPGIAHPVSFLILRTQPMFGPAGLFVGVRIDRFLPPNSLAGAATRFHISPREVQVLARLLDGDHLDQIAEQLNITSSTVQDHIKSMLDKTASRNRSELIARVLGWESPASPRAEL